MTHREAMEAPIQREAMHRIPNEWDREQADTAPYSADDMSAVVRWAIVALCVLALAVALSPAFWSFV